MENEKLKAVINQKVLLLHQINFENIYIYMYNFETWNFVKITVPHFLTLTATIAIKKI